MRFKVFLLAALFLFACGEAPKPPAGKELLELPWAEIEAAARGQYVTLAMWTGDPFINAYVEKYVTPALAERYGIDLDMVSGQGAQIVSVLSAGIEAGMTASACDFVWINGETFYQLRQIEALFGPFTDQLPNSRWIDYENPFIAYDFQQPIEGYEAPWGNVQLALIYDSARVAEPPRTRAELAAWVRAHPGRFTFDTSFTGMTFLKSLLIDIAGGPGSLDGPFDPERYARASAELWAYLLEIKPFLWRNGETYPNGVAQLHQLFVTGEIDFTMSNNDGEVDNKVLQGLLPKTSRAYVLEGGTIRNSHYLGIVRYAPHLAAALVAINFLLSPEAQYEKLKPAVWGDGTVLAVDRLPIEWQKKFRNVPQRIHAPPRSALEDKALREPAAEYMIRIHEDFRTHVLGG